MIKHILALSAAFILCISDAHAQNLDGHPFDPARDPNIDLYMNSWHDSPARTTHGALIERDILTKGDPMDPPRKGAVLTYTTRYVYATLPAGQSTDSFTLDGEQYVLFIDSGSGSIKSGWFKKDEIHASTAVLIPEDKKVTISNTGDEPLNMYLISEPVPAGFDPIGAILVKHENLLPIRSSSGHWAHIVKELFVKEDGLATLYSVFTVAHDPMTIGHPHSHDPGCEEVWTQIRGTSIAFIGKKIRRQPTGTAYNIPPNSQTPHCNVNTTDEQVKHLYFSVRKDIDGTEI